MNNLNKKDFADLIAGIGEVYSKQVSKAMMTIYFDALKGFDIDQVKLGFNQHVIDPKHGSFFPKPADIIRQLQTKEIPTEDKALLAWNQIIREMRRVGSYGSLKLDDRQAMAAIKAVKSWKDLCAMPESGLTWVKKEFMANYSMYDHTPLDALPSSLPGLEELENHKKNKSTSAIGLADIFKRLDSEKSS